MLIEVIIFVLQTLFTINYVEKINAVLQNDFEKHVSIQLAIISLLDTQVPRPNGITISNNKIELKDKVIYIRKPNLKKKENNIEVIDEISREVETLSKKQEGNAIYKHRSIADDIINSEINAQLQ